MSKQQTAVEWLVEQLRQLAHNPKTHLGMGDVMVTQGCLDDLLQQAKQMEKERASTFGIRVFPECSSLKTGRMEIDLQKFENLLNEMYGE